MNGTNVNNAFRFALLGTDDAPIVVLTGNLDHAADPATLDLLRDVVRSARPCHWTIDASRLGFVDSTAIRLLVDLRRIVGAEDLRVIPTPLLARLIGLVCVPGLLSLEDQLVERPSSPAAGSHVTRRTSPALVG